jgi:hypothetical protein
MMTDLGLSQADCDALERCMELAQRDPERAEQLRSMLGDEPWDEVAEFASHCCQYYALSLRPWQSPPSSVDEDDPDERDKDAQQLLRKMLAAGVSRYDPDPLQALRGRRRRRK